MRGYRRRNPMELLLLNPVESMEDFVWIDDPAYTQRFVMPARPLAVWLVWGSAGTAPKSKLFDPETGEVIGERPFRPAHGINAVIQEAGQDWSWQDGVLTLTSHSLAPAMRQGAWLFVQHGQRL